MAMPRFKNTVLAFSTAALALCSNAFGQEKDKKVSGGVKFVPPEEQVEKDSIDDKASLKSYMLNGEYVRDDMAMGDITVDDWRVLWQNSGVNRVYNPQYGAYINSTINHIVPQNWTPHFQGPSDYTLEEITQSDLATMFKYVVQDDNTDMRSQGEFCAELYVQYARSPDGNYYGFEVDPNVNLPMQKIMAIRTPYVLGNKTNNRTTIISYDKRGPNTLLLADYVTDANNQLVFSSRIANTAMKINFNENHAYFVEQEFDRMAAEAGRIFTHGAYDVSDEVSLLMHDTSRLNMKFHQNFRDQRGYNDRGYNNGGYDTRPKQKSDRRNNRQQQNRR